MQGDWGNFDLIAGFRFLGVNATTHADGTAWQWRTFGGAVSCPVPLTSGTASTGLFVPYYFDIGAGGSNLTWQIASGLGYQTGWAGVSLTYRYLSFQQSSSAVVQHLWIRGPMIMANFTF